MNNAWKVARTLFLRLRFIFVFIAIGLVVGHWAWIQNVVDRLTRPASPGETVAGEFEWFCPMHPSVVRPGDKEGCPICGMPLSKRRHGVKEALPSGVLSRVQLTPFRIQQAGVATVPLEPRVLSREIRAVGTLDWDERRFSDLSARVAGRADELFVNFTGVRVRQGDPVYRLYSPDLVATQEEYLLAIKGLDTATVAGGETAQRAKRLVESTRERLRLWGVTDAQIGDLEKTRKAQTHLTIVSPASGIVTKKNIHAGHLVNVGDDPYTLVDDSVLWVQAEIFERDLPLVKLDQPVEISSESWSGPPIQGKTVFIAPTVDPETRTTKVRIEVPNAAGTLKAGMFVTAVFRVQLEGQKGPEAPAGPSPAKDVYLCEMHPEEVFDKPGVCAKGPCAGPPPMKLGKEAIPAGSRLVYVCPDHPDVWSDKPGTCPKDGKKLAYRILKDEALPSGGRILAIPVSAVIDTGTRKVAFVEKGHGIFDAVEVGVGPRAGEYYPLLKGLAPGDRVVTQGAFLLDAETRLNPAAAAAYFGAETKK